MGPNLIYLFFSVELFFSQKITSSWDTTFASNQQLVVAMVGADMMAIIFVQIRAQSILTVEMTFLSGDKTPLVDRERAMNLGFEQKTWQSFWNNCNGGNSFLMIIIFRSNYIKEHKVCLKCYDK